MPHNPKEQTSEIPPEQYKEFHRLMPVACVDIVLTRGNSFLLVKRKNAPARNEWWFPGGRILRDEHFADAVARKIFQETGLKTENPIILGIDETFFPDGPFGSSTHTINIVFQANTETNDVILDNQSGKYQWFGHIDEKWDPYVKKFLSKAGFK